MWFLTLDRTVLILNTVDVVFVLYIILGRYFGMISRNSGMKIYYYLLFTEKNPVLDQ